MDRFARAIEQRDAVGLASLFTAHCVSDDYFCERFTRYEDFIADTPGVVAAMAGKLSLAFD